jgi:hypothetical protein
MGYIIATGLFLLVMIVIVAALKPDAEPAGRLPIGHPVEHDKAAAAEATPDASATSDSTTVQHSQHRVPSA